MIKNKNKISNFLKFIDNNIVITILIFVLLFVFHLFLNYITPLMLDDFNYRETLNQNLSILDNLINGIKFDYFNWTGRIIPHLIDRLFLNFDKKIFNIFNTIVYIIFIFNLVNIVRPNDKKISNFLILLFISLVWLTASDYKEVVLWQTGSLNYLWGASFCSICLITIFKDYKIFNNILFNILFFIFCIISSDFQENMTCGMCTLLFFNLLFKIYFKKQIKITDIYIFIAFLIGLLLLIFSPGVHNRSNIVADWANNYWWEVGFFKYIWRFFRSTYFIIIYLMPDLILIFLFTVIYTIQQKFKFNKFKKKL